MTAAEWDEQESGRAGSGAFVTDVQDTPETAEPAETAEPGGSPEAAAPGGRAARSTTGPRAEAADATGRGAGPDDTPRPTRGTAGAAHGEAGNTPQADAADGAAVTVHGTVAEGYEPLREAFVRNFGQRGETGAAVTVYREGRKVVDLWGGTADPREPLTGPPWTAETAAVIRSATKGPAAAVPHLLHQRGQLDLDAPVSTYWPEFAAEGKGRVLVRDLLAHRAGLPALDTPLSPRQAIDGVSAPRALAAQAPQWRPGTAHGYHAQTYGWLLSELVRRVTGRQLGRWFAEEVAEPLGLELWLGLPERESHRAAHLAPVAAPEPARARNVRIRPKSEVAAAYLDPTSLTRRAFDVIQPAPDENDPDYRAAGLAASGGIATARGLARFYAALIGPLAPTGGETGAARSPHSVFRTDARTGWASTAFGVARPPRQSGAGRPPGGVGAAASGGARRLFTPATLTQARSEESAGPDRVLVVPTRFGLGFMLHGSGAPMLGRGSFGHPGRGGSLGFADPESGTAFGYVTAGLQKSVTSDPRAQALVRALRECHPQDG